MNKHYRLLLVAPLFAATINTYAQTAVEKPHVLYGVCTTDSLKAAPFDKWFNTGYDSYVPNAALVIQLKKQKKRVTSAIKNKVKRKFTNTQHDKKATEKPGMARTYAKRKIN